MYPSGTLVSGAMRRGMWQLKIEQAYSAPVSTKYDFPPELIDAERQLVQAREDLAATYAKLPQYTDEWSEQDTAHVAELQELQRTLAEMIQGHEHWSTYAREDLVEARMALKRTGKTEPSTT